MSDKKSERKILLDRAEECVLKERNVLYGDPSADFKRIAAMWSILFDREFTSHEVGMAMVCLKLSRLTWAPGHFDSYVDAAGYMACSWECAVEEAKHADTKGTSGTTESNPGTS